MELTDKNGTGNYSKFEFQKGADNSVEPQIAPSFSAISILWGKSGTVDINEVAIADKIQFFPNPTRSIFHIKGENISEIEILNLSGTLIFKNEGITRIDMCKYRNGIYLEKIRTNSGIVIKKLVKE